MPSGTDSVTVLSVAVTFDYNGGTPNWTVPSPIVVNHGEVELIQWNLTCLNLPANTTGRFAWTNAVNFVTRKAGTNGDTWTGPSPQRVSDTQVEVTDDNRGPSTTKEYFYSINIETVDGNGNATGWTDDPQVENPGG
jgi:hypothetical protein